MKGNKLTLWLGGRVALISVPLACALFWQSLAALPQLVGRLEVAVISGADEDNGPPGSLSRLPIVLEVRGQNGPIAGATVTLTLPASGASGVFENGQTMTTVTTGPDGRVSFRIRRNKVAGLVVITASASYPGVAPVNLTIPRHNAAGPNSPPMRPLMRAVMFGSVAASATVGVLFGMGVIQGNPSRNLPKTTVTISTPTGPAPPAP